MKLRVLSDYPAIVVLFIWMLGPLIATIYYSFIRYNLLNPRIKGFAGIENYEFLLTDFVFTDSIYNSGEHHCHHSSVGIVDLLLVGSRSLRGAITTVGYHFPLFRDAYG